MHLYPGVFFRPVSNQPKKKKKKLKTNTKKRGIPRCVFQARVCAGCVAQCGQACPGPEQSTHIQEDKGVLYHFHQVWQACAWPEQPITHGHFEKETRFNNV